MTSEEENLQTCRACLLLSQKMCPIFETALDADTTIVSMLNYFSIKIIKEDHLPKGLCPPCVSSLCTAYKFMETFMKSQKILTDKSGKKSSVLDFNGINQINSLEESEPGINESGVYIKRSMNPSFKKNEEAFEEDVTITCDDDSDESVDEDYLIAKSVRLTEKWRMYKNDTTDSDSDRNFKQVQKTNSEGLEETSTKPSDPLDLVSCPICSHFFENSSLLTNHVIQHNLPLECKDCCLRFISVDSYLKHYQEHKYSCNICNKWFLTRDLCSAHIKMHNKCKKFVCTGENCTKTFKSKQALKSHFETMHSENRNFLCNLCGAAFKNCDNLRYHIKKHQGPSHICKDCGQGFMQAVHLKDHMWRHTGEKPFKCLKCEKSFLTNKHLKRHTESHCGTVRKKRSQD